MPKEIAWTLSVNPEGEQPIEKEDAMTVDDYIESEVTVQAESTKTVEIQSSSEYQVSLLAIEPQDIMDQRSNALTCKFSGAETDVRLDKLLVLVGDGEWKLLGGAPQGIEFTNNTENPVDVKVTVGIRATADSPTDNGNDYPPDNGSDSPPDNGNG